MLDVVIGVLVIEVDKVADELADMEVDKVVDMVLKIPDEGFADVSLKFDNTKKDNDRCGEW